MSRRFVSDDELVAFANDVTPEDVAAKFGLQRATAMRRMRKLELAGKIDVALEVKRDGYVGSGYGHNNLSYHRVKTT
jgi:CRP-like cAMP-binding protein